MSEFETLERASYRVQKALIDAALIRTRGNITQAAEQLDINRTTLRKILDNKQAYGFQPRRGDAE